MSAEKDSISRSEITMIAFQSAMVVVNSHSLLPEKEPPIFIEEACLFTGYERSTIYSLIHKKQIPFHKAAGRRKLIFFKTELLGWLKSSPVIIENTKEVSHA